MRPAATRVAFATIFLALCANAIAHGDEAMEMDMDMHASPSNLVPVATSSPNSGTDGTMSYFAYSKHSTTIMIHISLMILGWCFVLPAGKKLFP